MAPGAKAADSAASRADPVQHQVHRTDPDGGTAGVGLPNLAGMVPTHSGNPTLRPGRLLVLHTTDGTQEEGRCGTVADPLP